MATGKDRFAALANGGAREKGEIPPLPPLPPLPIERRFLEKTDGFAPFQRIIKTQEELEKEFRENLRFLREKYASFLEDHSTPVHFDSFPLRAFSYRKECEEDRKDFGRVLRGEGSWEEIRVPHYEGPVGVWNSFYRAKIVAHPHPEKHLVLRFEAIDYRAEVYWNGRLVKNHEGFFSPFDADVTPYLKDGENILLIVVHNDITSSNNMSLDGQACYGPKIYGCTGFGYDEPQLGWHHCPPGAGIVGEVSIEERGHAHVRDVYVDPDIRRARIVLRATVFQSDVSIGRCRLFARVEPSNFTGKEYPEFEIPLKPLQPYENYVEYALPLPGHRLWEPERPYLYALILTLKDEDGTVVERGKTFFGMREFRMDAHSKPNKGAFYLNGRRIMLRGTNEMGHLPRDVMEGKKDQLIEDILIAKEAGLNFFRMTQRPVFRKIYDACDRLGMLVQSDFPLFSYLKADSLGSALAQVDEMELLTRNHPSVILETFCNEALDKTVWGEEQYVMSRREMETFFQAAHRVVAIRNPSRVLKYNEGDYAPLKRTYGISDFHCYTFWYVSHCLPSGMMRKGWIPGIRKGWFSGCGEFGVEGLDSYELMKKYAPKEWLPSAIGEPWSPSRIARAQTYALGSDFFPEQDDILSWIKASREYQAKAIKDYVDLIRFRSDVIEESAVHLLIDAWPMGWMKALVDVDRHPKPAYYAFREANRPVRIYLRRDQYSLYVGHKAVLEAYAFNDTTSVAPITGALSLYRNGKPWKSFALRGNAAPCATTYLGEISFTLDAPGMVRAVAEMGMSREEREFSFLPLVEKARRKPTVLSPELACLSSLGQGEIDPNFIAMTEEEYGKNPEKWERKAEGGATLYVYVRHPMTCLGEDVFFRTHWKPEEVRANNLIYPASSPYGEGIGFLDLQNFYNARKGYADLSAWFKFDVEMAHREILYTLEESSDPTYAFHKRHRMICCEIPHGKGKIILSTLSALNGCVGENPALDRFYHNLLDLA